MNNEIDTTIDVSGRIIYRYVRTVEIFVYILFSTYIPVNFLVGLSLEFLINLDFAVNALYLLLDFYSLILFLVYVFLIYRYRRKIKKAIEPVMRISVPRRRQPERMHGYRAGSASPVFSLLITAVGISALLDILDLSAYEFIPIFIFYISGLIWFINVSRSIYDAMGSGKLIRIDLLAFIGFSVGYLGGIFISDAFFILFTLTWLFSGIFLYLENRGSGPADE